MWEVSCCENRTIYQWRRQLPLKDRLLESYVKKNGPFHTIGEQKRKNEAAISQNPNNSNDSTTPPGRRKQADLRELKQYYQQDGVKSWIQLD